jgi:phosphopantothenoylcysteine decarboxylase/phosphopantothenate--cysteine ligase
MTQLANKHIVLGITGGIAAYKAAELSRRLKEAGADVRAVMTDAAQQFITPLTLQALTGNPVGTSLLDPQAEAAMGHIELARWADFILVAPASADFMARLAGGHADDLLTTLMLASDAPQALAPAMNQAMWADTATQTNTAILQQRGVQLFGPGSGDQACGDTGPGRMLEPDQLRELTANQFARGSLASKRVVITAGPTREALDPVRYISNHSSGKMGYALATAAQEAGAAVTLISGPVSLACPHGVKRVMVSSAQQMLEASLEAASPCDLFIATAAVADYRPATPAANKIKKSSEAISIELTRNPDIVATISDLQPRPFTVGFAAETQNVITYARGKLEKKKLDMLVANDVSNPAIGFNSNDNEISVLWADEEQHFPTASKDQLARQLIELIASHIP